MEPYDENLNALIAQAAAMRAVGKTWQTIATELDRSSETVRRWPERHPKEWIEHYRTVESYIIAEAAGEARLILRNMLRAKKGHFRLHAARHLLKSRDTDRQREFTTAAQTPTDWRMQKMFDEVRAVSDEELDRDIDDYIKSKNDLSF